MFQDSSKHGGPMVVANWLSPANWCVLFDHIAFFKTLV